MAQQSASSAQTRKNTRGTARSRTQSTRGTRAGQQNALTLLRADHDEVLQLFEKFESASRSDQKQRLATQICTELKIHTRIEEEVFYPAVREAGAKDEESALDEAKVEHDGAAKLIEEIEASDSSDELFDARMKVLSEYIKHHVKEEYREIFPAAKSADIDLDEIGAQLAARKKELKAELRRH